MRPAIFRRPARSIPQRSGERGVTLALVAVAMFTIIAMAGLSIDAGTLYEASTEAQRSADAAALAAARAISLSGITGDPNNTSNQWSIICNAATTVAQAVAAQNPIGGAAPSPATVTFPAATDGSTCTSPAGIYAVNPKITVQVTQTNLPAYFSRIWGRTGSSVSASATAEVFNPSFSAANVPNSSMIPVQPRCVKPIIVPNVDPGNPVGCKSPACQPLINVTLPAPLGTINNPGIQFGGGGSGAIGEEFYLQPDCPATGNCNIPPPKNPPRVTSPPTALQYVPGIVSGAPVGVPSCATGGGGANGYYQQAIAGCDQSTVYQCGVQNTATPSLDLTENPALPTSDVSVAAQCLIHGDKDASAGPDSLFTNAYPYQIIGGTGNPVVGASGNSVTSSDSIITIPIYANPPTNQLSIAGTSAPVTIVGFLQVFVKSVVAGLPGTLDVVVLNVAGCGNQVPAGTPAIAGTSPVPIRLITPP
jgi:Flp pilus assembly protein TadG